MSGPKSSRYYMSRVQRQLLLEQLKKRREEEILKERKRNELEVIKRSCEQLKNEVSGLKDIIDRTNKLAGEGFEGTVDVLLLRSICEEASNEISKAEELGTNAELEKIRETSQNISSVIRKVHSGINTGKNSLVYQEGLFRDETINSISSGFELSFANISNRNQLKENKYLQLIVDELDKLVGLTISNELKQQFELLREKADEITSVDYIQNFYSISVIPFVKKCKEYDRLYSENGEEYKNLCLRYEYLADKLNQEADPVPFSQQAISILLERIAFLEAEELRVNEEAYICQCIDEAMSELNYEVIGSRNVTKKNGKQFRSVLYEFDEGTAVNVTYSNDGQITMELGGVSTEDRLPTEAESESLEEDMHAFCDDFHEIEKRLKARGIETEHILHLPPEAQFAQIINSTDYEMTKDIGKFVAKTTNRKRGDSTGATLHREE